MAAESVVRSVMRLRPKPSPSSDACAPVLKRLGEFFLIAVAALAVAGGIVWAVRAMNASDDRAARDEARAFARANTVCGGPPARIIAHNSSWSHGPWIEVRCADGTTRAVKG